MKSIKRKLTLSVDVDKIKALKKKALDADMTLSDLMVKSACEVDIKNFTAGSKNIA